MLRPPGPNDDGLQAILFDISEAQKTLDAAVAKAQALPDTEPSKAVRITRLNALKREVDRTFSRLEVKSDIWSRAEIPRSYASGWLSSAVQMDAGFDFTLPHQEAIETLVDDAFSDVATGLRQARSSFTDKVNTQLATDQLSTTQKTLIQVKGKSAVTQQLLTGLRDTGDTAKLLRDELWRDGVKIIDRSGRTWGMENYTRMLVRTKSAMAYNSGSLGKYAEEGVRKVQVFDGDYDAQCADANGQIWTIKYAQQHAIAHPNCRRAFGPAPGARVVNRVTSDELQEVGLTVASKAWQTMKYLQVARSVYEFYLHPGVINIHDGLIARTAIRAELEAFNTSTIDEFISETERYLEDVIDPALARLGVLDITDFPDHIQKDWAFLNSRINESRAERGRDYVRKTVLFRDANIPEVAAEPIGISPRRITDFFRESSKLVDAETLYIIPDFDKHAVQHLGRVVGDVRSLPRNTRLELLDVFRSPLDSSLPLRHYFSVDLGITEQDDLLSSLNDFSSDLRTILFRSGTDGVRLPIAPVAHPWGGTDISASLRFPLDRLAVKTGSIKWNSLVADFPSHWRYDRISDLSYYMDNVQRTMDRILGDVPITLQQSDTFHSSTIDDVLRAVYGKDNVRQVSGTSANGKVYLVSTPDDTVMVVKRLIHDPMDAVKESMSQTIEEALGRDSMLVRFMSGGDDSTVIQLSNFIPSTGDELSDQQVVQASLLDGVLSHRDGHGANYIEHQGRRYLIDRGYTLAGSEFRYFPGNVAMEHLADLATDHITGRRPSSFVFPTSVGPVKTTDEIMYGLSLASSRVGTPYEVVWTITEPTFQNVVAVRTAANQWQIPHGIAMATNTGNIIGRLSPIHYVTPAQMDTLRGMANHGLTDDLLESVRSLPKEVHSIIDDAYGGQPSSGIDAHAALWADRLTSRVREAIDHGLITATDESGILFDRGLFFERGRLVRFSTADELVEGTVDHVFHDTDGNPVVRIIRGWDPEIGPIGDDLRATFHKLDDIVTDGETTIGSYLTDISQTVSNGNLITSSNDELIGLGEDFLKLPDPLTSQLTRDLRDARDALGSFGRLQVPRLDEFGGIHGWLDGQVVVDTTSVRSFSVGGRDWSGIQLNRGLDAIVAGELEAFHPSIRPKRIVLQHEAVRDGGKIGFGMYDTASDTATVSLVNVFDPDTGAFLPSKFRETLRHELVHAAKTNTQRNTRATATRNLINKVAKSMYGENDMFPVPLADLDYAIGTRFGDEGVLGLRSYVKRQLDVIEDLSLKAQEEQGLELLRRLSDDPPGWAKPLLKRVDSGEQGVGAEAIAEAFANGRTDELLASMDGPYWRPIQDMDLLDPLVLWETGNFGVPSRYYRDPGLIDQESLNSLFVRAFKTPAEEGGGGFTYDIVRKGYATEGHAVAIKPREKVIEGAIDLTEDQFDEVVADYVLANSDVLETDGFHLGGWVRDDGALVLDSTKVHDDFFGAAEFGFHEEQDAMFDLSTFNTTYLLGRDEAGRPAFLDYDEFADWYVDHHLAALRGYGKDAGELAVKIVRRPDGKAAPMSLRYLPDYIQEKIRKAYSDGRLQTDEGVLSVTQESITNNLVHILRTAERNLTAEGADQFVRRFFYQEWNKGLLSRARDKGVSVFRGGAVGAAMSPGLEAEANLRAALLAIDSIDRRITKSDLDGLLKDFIRPRLKQYREEVRKVGGDPAEAVLKRIREHEAIVNGETIRAGMSFKELEAEDAVQMLRYWYLQEYGGRMPGGPAGSWTHYETALKILGVGSESKRIPDSLIPALFRGTKVRSFFNNAMDPLDVLGYHDVTIDFQMTEAAVFVIGMKDIGSWWDSPSTANMELGLRTLIAEALWDILNDPIYAETLARLQVTNMAELQEVLWLAWKQGKDRNWWGSLLRVRKT